MKKKKGTPSFHDFTRQASIFLRDKFKTARLALTDVTPVQLLTEESTKGSLCSPDARSLHEISRAAFEVDDYYRIVDVLHTRLYKFDLKRWRSSYNALVLLEHLLTHGPLRVADEFQSDKEIIKEMTNFQFVDQKGFNWGASVKKLSEKILLLLEDEALLKEERARARKLSLGIKGFGSFSHHSGNTDQNFEVSKTWRRCRSYTNIQNKGHESEMEKISDQKGHPFCQEDNESTVSLLNPT